MVDHFAQFLIGVVVWLSWGLFYEFMSRRSNDPKKRSVGKAAGLVWICIGAWMIYNLVMWQRFPQVHERAALDFIGCTSPLGASHGYFTGAICALFLQSPDDRRRVQAEDKQLWNAIRAMPGCARLAVRIRYTRTEFYNVEDSKVIHVVNDRINEFLDRVGRRILAEHSDQVFMNRCPRCGTLARTSTAKQCHTCFFDWHDSQANKRTSS